MTDPSAADSKRLTQTAIRLFDRFDHKLSAIRREASRLHDGIVANSRAQIEATDHGMIDLLVNERNQLERNYMALDRQFGSLRPSLLKLTRQFSQRLEFAEIDDIDRIELEVRLDEFQGEVDATQEFLIANAP